MSGLDLSAGANFSECGRYRWSLSRTIALTGFPVAIIGYNPSMAGATRDDPTIRREIAFARAWGAAVLIKVNAFAGISPYPDDLAAMDDPVGPRADEAIRAAADFCLAHGGILVATWGVPKGRAATKRLAERRFAAIRALGLPLHYLRLTAGGYPEHTLYLPGNLTPVLWGDR